MGMSKESKKMGYDVQEQPMNCKSSSQALSTGVIGQPRSVALDIFDLYSLKSVNTNVYWAPTKLVS